MLIQNPKETVTTKLYLSEISQLLLKGEFFYSPLFLIIIILKFYENIYGKNMKLFNLLTVLAAPKTMKTNFYLEFNCLIVTHLNNLVFQKLLKIK